MSEPTTSLSLIAFDADADAWDLFDVDDCAAGALSYLANAETVVGIDLSLPLIDAGHSSPILKIERRGPATLRVAG